MQSLFFKRVALKAAFFFSQMHLYVVTRCVQHRGQDKDAETVCSARALPEQSAVGQLRWRQLEVTRRAMTRAKPLQPPNFESDAIPARREGTQGK